MKKAFLILATVMCSVVMMAQELPQGLGIQMGYTQPILRLNSPYVGVSGDSLMNTTLNGFKVGLMYDATIIKGFGSTIGLNYTFAMGQTAWKKVSSTQVTQYPQYREKNLYQELELFVDWQYKFELAKETYIILYTGPTIQCALQWNNTGYIKSMVNDPVKEDPSHPKINRYSSDDGDLRRLNVTWGLGAGFQYKRYFIRGGYDFGLINPYKKQTFSELGYENTSLYVPGRYTRGRLDQWSIKIGIYIWQQ